MDIRKRNPFIKINTRTRPNQEDGKRLPAITKKYSIAKQKKTDASFNYPSPQQNKSTLNQLKSTFRLPRINVKRESFSVCKRCYSHSNLCTSSGTICSDNSISSLNSFGTRKIDFQLQDAMKVTRSGTDLVSTERLLKSLRIVDLEISGSKMKFQRENSLRICRMELIPRCTRKHKKNTVKELSRSELQATYPTLKLSATDKNAILSLSPSTSFSMESLDSIVGGSLSLTQPPPDFLSSCSPSETELTFTPPSTP